MFYQSISVLGCGWLGFPLAQKLTQKGYLVKGSTTSKDKLSLLKDSGIAPFLLKFPPKEERKESREFFESDALFLNIPFKRSLTDPKIYQNQISSVINYVVRSPIRFVIFASSTSIYPDHLKIASEDIRFQPENPRSQTLFAIEQNLMKQKQFYSTILRFAGLYGGQRKIGQFLKGKKELKSGHQPANLVHLADCLAVVEQIINENIHSAVFNVCSDEHPIKKELYTRASLKMGLLPPEFSEADQTLSGKIVSNQKLKEALGYQFIYPDPLATLEEGH